MSVYENANASLLKYCSDFIIRHGLDEHKFQVFDFDDHITANALPNANLIGIGEFSMENLGELYYFTCFISVAIQSTEKIKLLKKVIGKLSTELEPGADVVKYVTSDEGVNFGRLIVKDTVAVLPIAKNETMPMQLIAVSFAGAVPAGS